MREIKSQDITNLVKQLAVKATIQLPNDVINQIKMAQQQDPSELAQKTLARIVENAEIASKQNMPLCQDTGMAMVYVTIGQDVHVTGLPITDAINQGIREGYQEAYLRKSIVDDPLFDRINTQDNTPAIIHYDIVAGDGFKIKIAPKGFGSENMSQIKMLKPSDGVDGVKDFVMKVVEEAGPNACPPMVIGVGIGGSFDKVTMVAKEAMMREIGTHHPDQRYANLETELLNKINATGIGPAGFGGQTTALSLNIETYPTHIAGMPVAVSICCHSARHMEGEL